MGQNPFGPVHLELDLVVEACWVDRVVGLGVVVDVVLEDEVEEVVEVDIVVVEGAVEVEEGVGTVQAEISPQ